MMKCLICIERRKGVTQVQQSTSTRWPEQIGATVRWERRWRTQTECGKKCANVREVAENHQVRDTSKQMEPLVFSPFIFLSCKLRTPWYIDCSTSVTLGIKPFIWQAGSPYRPGMKAFGLMKGWGLWLKHYTIQQSLLKSRPMSLYVKHYILYKAGPFFLVQQKTKMCLILISAALLRHLFQGMMQSVCERSAQCVYL